MEIHHIITHWHDNDRVVFMTSDFHGVVEIEFPKSEPEVGYIWHLWVDEGFRQRGYASQLLFAAEKHIFLQCKSKASLCWDKQASPEWVLDWYKKTGYKEVESDGRIIELEKEF